MRSFFDPRIAAFARELALECIDALYPPTCALCRSRDWGDGLGCSRHRLPLGALGARCGICSRALPPAIADGERCAGCRARSPGYERLIALADYRGQPVIQDWILALKYGRRADLARTLGAALGAHWRAERDVNGAAHARRSRAESEEGSALRELLVPVPLHGWRRLERGYDQSLELSRSAGRSAGLRVVRALRRVRATAVQGAPGSPSRTANVDGAFAPRRFAARRVRGTFVWIVDDVVTSGATVAECARVLRRMGAARVGVLALARASS